MAVRNPVTISIKRLMRGLPVKGGVTINEGEIVTQITATGMCTAGGTQAASRGVGIAAFTAVNGGADGSVTIDVWQGVFLLDADPTNPPTSINIGGPVKDTGPNTVDNGTAGLNNVGTCVGLGFSGEPGVQVEIEE